MSSVAGWESCVVGGRSEQCGPCVSRVYSAVEVSSVVRVLVVCSRR